MRALLLCLLITGAVVAAPAPRAKEVKGPPQITAGDYSYEWSGDTNNLTLDKNGQYKADWCGMEYYGFWRWNTRTRCLEIWEACDEGAKGRMETGNYQGMEYYQFTLNDDFKVKDGERLLWLKKGRIEIPNEFDPWKWL